MKKIRISFIIKTVIIILLVLLGTIALIDMNKIGVLPTKYLIMSIIFIILLIALAGLLMFLKKTWKNIIGYVLSGLLIIGFGIGIYYLKTTNDFLDNNFSTETITYSSEYYIVSLNNDMYTEKNIKEVYYYGDLPNFDVLSKKYKDYKYILGDDIEYLINKLGTDVTYMVIEKNTYHLFFDMMSDYDVNNYKILKTLNIDVTEEIKKSEEIKDNKINIYIGGTDFTNQFYDFNMVITINTDTHEVLLTSIPRDYYITVAGKGRRDILGYHGVWGVNTQIGSLNNLLDININYYVKINTHSLVGLVNTLGGLEFCNNYKAYTSTHSLVLDTYSDNKEKLYVKKGCNYYNGIEILTIARERLAYPGGDRDRQKNCQRILISLFNKLTKMSNLLKYNDILNAVSALYTTNIPRDLITSNVKDMIDNKTKWTFKTQSLNGGDSRNFVHLSNIKDYVMEPYQDSINNARNNIKSL